MTEDVPNAFVQTLIELNQDNDKFIMIRESLVKMFIDISQTTHENFVTFENNKPVIYA